MGRYKVKALDDITYNDKRQPADSIFEINSKDADNLVNLGAIAILEVLENDVKESNAVKIKKENGIVKEVKLQEYMKEDENDTEEESPSKPGYNKVDDLIDSINPKRKRNKR